MFRLLGRLHHHQVIIMIIIHVHSSIRNYIFDIIIFKFHYKVLGQREHIKGKGAGLSSDNMSEDLSSAFTFYPMATGPVHSCAISTPRKAYSPAVTSVHRTFCRLHIANTVLPGTHFHKSNVKLCI